MIDNLLIISEYDEPSKLTVRGSSPCRITLKQFGYQALKSLILIMGLFRLSLEIGNSPIFTPLYTRLNALVRLISD